MLEKNFDNWLTTSKKMISNIHGNTRKYLGIPGTTWDWMFKCLLPKIKKDTRKYLNVYFYTPIRPEPDSLRRTRYFFQYPTWCWKTLPVGHWWQSLQFTNSKNVNLSRRQFPCGSPIIQSHKLPRTQTPCNTNIIIHCSMYFCNCRTTIAVTPFPDKLAFIWKELPGWGASHLCMLPISHYYHQSFFILWVFFITKDIKNIVVWCRLAINERCGSDGVLSENLFLRSRLGNY